MQRTVQQWVPTLILGLALSAATALKATEHETSARVSRHGLPVVESVRRIERSRRNMAPKPIAIRAFAHKLRQIETLLLRCALASDNGRGENEVALLEATANELLLLAEEIRAGRPGTRTRSQKISVVEFRIDELMRGIEVLRQTPDSSGRKAQALHLLTELRASNVRAQHGNRPPSPTVKAQTLSDAERRHIEQIAGDHPQ